MATLPFVCARGLRGTLPAFKARTAPDKTAIECQIAATDRDDETLRRAQGDLRGRIDQLVHELYSMTEDEIGIVKGEQTRRSREPGGSARANQKDRQALCPQNPLCPFTEILLREGEK